MSEAGAIRWQDAGIAFRPDRVVKIAVGALLRRDVLVAIGRGEARALLRDEKARGSLAAFDVEAHHIGEFVAGALDDEIGQRGQGMRLATGAKPCVEHDTLHDGSDHRPIGADEFHFEK